MTEAQVEHEVTSKDTVDDLKSVTNGKVMGVSEDLGPPEVELQSETGIEQVQILVKKSRKKRFEKDRKTRASTKIHPNLIALNNGRYLCKLCNKSSSKLSHGRRHLKYFCRKGEKGKKKSDPNIIPTTSSRKDPHICNLCNKSFANYYNAQIHLKYSCKKEEKKCDPNLIPTTSSWRDPHICKLCNKSFAHLYSAKRHLKYFCTKGETKCDPNLIPTTSSKLGKHICKLCSKEFAHYYSARRHLKYTCCKREEMKCDLGLHLNLIPTSSSKKDPHICKLCNKSFVNLYAARRHLKYYCSKGEREPLPSTTTTSAQSQLLTCSYCTFECASHRHCEMKQHFVHHHPETFFLSLKNNSILPLSCWKDENFKIIVMKIIFPNFILRNGTSSSCSVCGYEYSKNERFSWNSNKLKIHLVNKHLQELREYLKEIMEQWDDAFLQEKLDNLQKQPLRYKRPIYICKFCDQPFANSTTGRRHENFCFEKGKSLPRPRPPPPPDSEDEDDDGMLFSCAYCGYKNQKSGNREHLMKNHLIRRHPEMFFQSERNISSLSKWKNEHFKDIVKEIVIPKFIERNNGTSASYCSCSVCGKNYESKKWFNSNRSNLIVHLINRHIEEVKEHLKDVLEESATSLLRKLRDASSMRIIKKKSKSNCDIMKDDHNHSGTDMNVDENCVQDEDVYADLNENDIGFWPLEVVIDER